MSMQKIGLFGGAFDPIHEGHLHIARLACAELRLNKVYFIPLKQAVHKPQPYFSEKERVAKIKKAIADNKYFELLLDELKRTEPSYSIDTVRNFLAERGGKTEIDLYYIIGTDAFEKFDTWKEPLELLKLVSFIVVSRPGYDFSKIEKIFSQGKYKEFIDKIYFIEGEGIDLSSTQIRERRYDSKNER